MFSVCENRTTVAYAAGHDFKVVEWHNNMPFPILGESVGIDTETEPITETVFVPPLVVLGVYNPEDNTCYVVPYEDAKLFMKELLLREPMIYMANAGYDYYELFSEQLEEHCSKGKLVDILIRAALNDVATEGVIHNYSLKDVCHYYLKYEMDKHEEEGEASVRLNFRRNKVVSEEALTYLGIDCYTTWKAGQVIPSCATEVVDTKGAIVLTHTRNNGFPVDKEVFDYFKTKLSAEYDKYKKAIISYGFPDPDKKKEIDDVVYVGDTWQEFQEGWLDARLPPTEQYIIRKNKPAKTEAVRLFLYLMNVVEGGNNAEELARTYATVRAMPDKPLCKAEKEAYNEFLDEFDFMGPVDACRKPSVLTYLLRVFMEEVHRGKQAAMHVVDIAIQNHPDWFGKISGPGPVVFLQEHLKQLCEDYPALKLDKTESGRLKCSKKDTWKLADCGIKDPFLENYVSFIHVQKYLSTYVNEAFIKSDRKVHTRYGMVTTGRTSSTNPNMQNLPSHDKEYELKLMYKPPEGTILVSTDYSFAELVALAQDCLTEFGKSTLADVINADVCPHYFYSGVMTRIIKPDTAFCKDPEAVAEMKAFLKDNIIKDVRQKAKAVNQN